MLIKNDLIVICRNCYIINEPNCRAGQQRLGIREHIEYTNSVLAQRRLIENNR
jgi:hypothetical protein